MLFSRPRWEQRALPRTLKRRGASIVQFAVVVPVFFLFIFGLVEIARGLMSAHLLTNAARAGCREGILQNKATSDIKSTVDSLLSSSGVPGASTTVKVNGVVADASTAQSNDEITVIVSVPVAQVTWVPGGQYLKGNITGQFSLRRE